jgi:hypothetical protein
MAAINEHSSRKILEYLLAIAVAAMFSLRSAHSESFH